MCDGIEAVCVELANEKVKVVAISQAGEKTDETQSGEMTGKKSSTRYIRNDT